MPTAIVPSNHNRPLAPLSEVIDQAREYARQSRAENTKGAYTSDWKHFTAWCKDHGTTALPASPETVALYITALAEQYKVSTLERRLASISQAHQLAGHSSPTKSEHVRTVMKGIRRARSTAPEGKAPMLTEDLRRAVAHLPEDLRGRRDRALLLVGFAGGFRRSELAGLNIEDVAFTREGLVIHLQRSKTDQEGQGRKVGIAYGSHPDTCPVRALEDWLRAAGHKTGPLFRTITRQGEMEDRRISARAVARAVKRAAQAAGLDPARYSGHSLRAGLATQAAMNGASERTIMQQTGHRSERMVRRYIREGSLFRENASAMLGL